MANLSENATYEAGIYQLETSDPVDAGTSGNGVSNLQAKQLANRTNWLNTKLLALLVGGGADNPVRMSKGGLGADNSARPAQQIPYTSAIGVIDWLATTAYGRSLLGQANAIETAQTLNIGLGRFAFAQNATQTATTSNTYQDTGLSLSITPQSANSKFFILAVPSLRINRPDGNGASAFIAIYRGAVPGGTLIGATRFNGNFGSTNMLSFSLNNSAVAAAVDSPNTTNPVTYGLGIRAASGEVTMNFGVDVDSLLFALEIIP